MAALGWLALGRAGADAVTPHLTDGQDRMMSGYLEPAAEARSEANALYAGVMCEDPGSNPQETLSRLRQVVALDPHFTDAQVKVARLLLQTGQNAAALAQLKSAIAENPGSASIQADLADAQRLCGQTDEARRSSTEALYRDANQSLAMRVLLEIASDQNDLDGAVLHIEDILIAGGTNASAPAWLTLASLYVEVARGSAHPPGDETVLKTLLPIYQQAASQPPPRVDVLSLLAQTYRDLGRKADALKTFRVACALDPANVDILLRCADLEIDLKRTADAMKDDEAAYALNPNQAGLREALGGLYLDNGRFEDAVRLLEVSLANGPADPGLEVDLGIAYEGAHQPGKAQACFQKAFATVACPPEAYLKLAGFQLAHQELAKAAGTLAAAQLHFPKSAKVRFYEAIEHRCEKNYDAALLCLAQTRTLAESSDGNALDPGFYLESAETLNLAGRQDLVEATLQEALDKYPDNPALMNELAYFWADQNVHLPEALALSEHAAQLDPENGPIEDTQGWVYFQMGRPNDALPYLQQAALMTDNDPVVLQHVGDAYLKLGLRREAIDAWRRALEKDPGNGGLINRIDAALAQAKNVHTRSAPNP